MRTGYNFGGATGLSYADLVRRRENALRLADTSEMPMTLAGGLGSIAQAFIAKNARDKANKALGQRNDDFRNALVGEAFQRSKFTPTGAAVTPQGRQTANQLVSQLGGTPAPSRADQLLALAGDERYSDAQRNLAMQLYSQEMGADDAALRKRLLEAQIAEAERGPATYETVQNPHGRGGVGQKNTQTGQISGYQAPVVAPDSRTNDQKNYDAAVAGGFKGSFNEWLLQKRAAGASSTNVSVNTGVDRPKPPAGYDYARNADGSVKVNENNEASLVPIEGGPQAAELAEAELGKEDRVFQLDTQLELIDRTLAHPGLQGAVGPIQGNLPPYNDATADFTRMVEQIQGTVFLEAFEGLKGGGQITEIESQKAEAAIARLNRVQSEAGFKQALSELQDILRRAKSRLTKAKDGDSDADILKKYGIN